MSRDIFRSGRGRLLPVVAIGVSLSLGLVALVVSQSAAQPVAPRPADRQVALAVSSLLKREHLTKHPLDDEMSKRALGIFLKTLDPMKLYFTQADVDEFKKHENDLDDMVRKGDMSFAYTVYKKFLERVDSNLKTINELIAAEHDFTLDEEMQTDSKSIVPAVTDEELRDRWRKRLKYDFLVQKSDKLEGDKAKEKLTRRYHSFAKRMHQIDDDELLEMFLTSFTSGFDPHTTYMSPSSLENFEIQMRLKLEGIGAALQFEDGNTKISKLIPGGAAEKDGRLKPEDRVIGVGQGNEGEVADTTEMSLSDVVKMIRGKRGTVVRLKVIPIGQTEPKIYDITRASIELKDSEARSEIFEEGKKADGSPYKIGVIDLPSFYMDMQAARDGVADYKSTTRDMRKILEQFQEKHVDAVILDLRRNGGGSLTEAISLTGLFIDEGPVVQVKSAEGRVQQFDDTERGTAWSGPLVVLTSKFSASASEIFAGAIQDYHRGLIVGDQQTHGKGTVQSLLDLGKQLFRVANSPPLGALKITMQQFYRPNGDSTQDRGVVADIALPSLTTHLDVGERDLDYFVKFDHVDPVPYSKLNLTSKSVVDELKSNSAARVEKSEDFAKVERNIARYKEQKARKSVSLNEEKFMKDREKLDADKEEEKELKELDDPMRPVVKRDFYFNEAVAITLDYLKLIKVASR